MWQNGLSASFVIDRWHFNKSGDIGGRNESGGGSKEGGRNEKEERFGGYGENERLSITQLLIWKWRTL